MSPTLPRCRRWSGTSPGEFGGLEYPHQQCRRSRSASASSKRSPKTGAARSTPASMVRSIAATPLRRTSRSGRNGRIVSVIGDSSRVGQSGLSIVAAARAGVIALMKSLAREFGRFGTTANAVSLGLVETAHDREWVDANRERLVKLYPLRRLGQANDVAPMVALLASPHCRLDHRPGAQHQRRIQHGLMEESVMLQTDLIGPIPELLRRHASARGDKLAYRDAQTSVTYAELEARTGRLAGHLADLGIAPGDTVAIMLPNSVLWMETASRSPRRCCQRANQLQLHRTEIGYRLVDANCKAIITTAERGDLFAKLRADAPACRSRSRRSRPCSAKALRYADCDGPTKSAPRDPSRYAHTRLYHLHVRHHRPCQGRFVDGARHAVGGCRLLGTDHRPERARLRALSIAAVSFLCVESVGARHSDDRRQRLHHGEISRPAKRYGS